MLSARAAVFYGTNVSKSVLILYTYSLFFEALMRMSAITELLRQFIPLSRYLTDLRINILHVCCVVFHFATLGGVLWYHITFSYPTEDLPIARWFRFGSFISSCMQSFYTIAGYVWQATMIYRHTEHTKKKVIDYPKKKRNVLMILMIILFFPIASFLHFTIALQVNDSPGTPGFLLYHYLMQLNLSFSLAVTILTPILFQAIVALKFERRNESATRKMEHETRLPWTEAPTKE
jgi:hypothetical protein